MSAAPGAPTSDEEVANFLAHVHPVLAVPCPDCRRRAGAMCVRPSGHRASDFHKSRKAAADAAFAAQHGEVASIDRTPTDWRIDPQGRKARGS